MGIISFERSLAMTQAQNSDDDMRYLITQNDFSKGEFVFCYVCGDKFHSLKDLGCHQEIHNHYCEDLALNQFDCANCHECFLTGQDLMNHFVNAGHTLYHCCGLGFKTAESFYSHKGLKIYHEYKCTYCSNDFDSYLEMCVHLATHKTDMVKVENAVNKEAYGTETDCDQHLDLYLEVDCEDNDISVKDEEITDNGKWRDEQLDKHLESDISKPGDPYVCVVCGKRFRGIGALKCHRHYHIRRNEWRKSKPANDTKKSSYVCKTCKTHFESSEELATHLLLHNATIKIKDSTQVTKVPEVSLGSNGHTFYTFTECNACYLSFKSLEDFAEHAHLCCKKVQNDNGVTHEVQYHSCETCLVSFHSPKELADHKRKYCMKAVEDNGKAEAFRCTVPSHPEVSEVNAVSNQQTASEFHGCNKCFISFTSQQELSKHKLIHNRNENNGSTDTVSTCQSQEPGVDICNVSSLEELETHKSNHDKSHRRKQNLSTKTSDLRALSQCKKCFIYFATVQDYEDHLLTHLSKTGEEIVCEAGASTETSPFQALHIAVAETMKSVEVEGIKKENPVCNELRVEPPVIFNILTEIKKPVHDELGVEPPVALNIPREVKKPVLFELTRSSKTGEEIVGEAGASTVTSPFQALHIAAAETIKSVEVEGIKKENPVHNELGVEPPVVFNIPREVCVELTHSSKTGEEIVCEAGASTQTSPFQALHMAAAEIIKKVESDKIEKLKPVRKELRVESPVLLNIPTEIKKPEHNELRVEPPVIFNIPQEILPKQGKYRIERLDPVPSFEKSKIFYRCKTCHLIFKDKSSLQKHRVIHTDSKPYKCNQCSESFRIETELKAHRRFHQGMPLNCQECNKGFWSTKTLRHHINKFHGNRPTFDCVWCSQKFTTAQAVTHHIDILHSASAGNT